MVASPVASVAAPAARPRLVPPPRSSSGGVDSDEVLGRVLEYVAAQGLSLYPAQEEAIFEILAGKHVVLATPTGSGKSLVATAFLYKALCDGKRGFYSCPVKALVNEKFFALCEAFGPESVALMTGDGTVNRGAPLVCGTAEILSNLILRGRARDDGAGEAPFDFVVMDEFHYYGDPERGMAWQVPLITQRGATFLLMSATLGDTYVIEQQLKAATGRDVASVRGVVRPVPLEFEYRETALHETISELVRSARAPVYLVNFTQRAAAEEAQNLTSLDLLEKPEKEELKRALAGERFGSPYGKELQRFLRAGVGLHHAGLLPRYRRLVERLAQRGLLKVVSGTDTLGVGVNIPIRTVVFTQLCKFDGSKDAILPTREFHQIAGRAGRKGFDDRGYVVAQAPAHVVENKKLAASGKKFVKRQPPKKGFVHWDKGTFERLRDGTPEPLQSRFTVSHGLLLALLQSADNDPRRGGGYGRLVELIAHCHDSDNRKRQHRRTAAAAFRTLRRAGLVVVTSDERARNPHPEPSPDLQHDFSLHQTLALWLIDTLTNLSTSVSPEGGDTDAVEHARNVLTLVEAILENPRPVLMAQLDRIKEEAIAAMKADGVPYEERIEKLDELEWPKPLREFIYDSFNAFAAKHPWVGNDNIQPKSVARDLVERFCSFHDYVRALGLARSEGVLLRYLSEAWKTLVQSVPVRFRTPELEELALSLGAVVRTVDASLLEEWQALRDPTGAAERALAAAHLESDASAQAEAARRTRGLRELARDSRAFAARLRAELHRLLGALARRDYQEAVAALGPTPEGLEPWTPERLEKELASYWAEHNEIVVTPAARSPQHTVVRRLDGTDQAPRWEAVQRVIDPAGNEDTVIVTIVDLADDVRAGLSDDTPLIGLLRVGV